MNGTLLDAELLPFAPSNVKTNEIKTTKDLQKKPAIYENGSSKFKFSKVLNQQLKVAGKQDGKTISIKGLKDKNIEKEQDTKLAGTDETLIKNAADLLQYLINILNITGQEEEGVQQSVSSEELAAAFQKEAKQILETFFQVKNLDIDDVSQKISQLLEKSFGIKLQPNTIANAIKTGNFKEVLNNFENINHRGEIAKTQDLDLAFFTLTTINVKEAKNNLTKPKEEKENIAQLNSQNFLSTDSKDNSTKSKNLLPNPNIDSFTIEKTGESEKKQSFQQDNFTFLKHDLNFFDNKSVQQNSKLQQKPEVKIFDQIINNIILLKNGISSTISIQLKPDFLGKLQINLKAVGGNIVANIITDSEKLKQQIESNLPILNSQLDLKGIKIDSFNVTVDKNMQFTSQYNGQQGFNDAPKQQNMQKGYANYLLYEFPQTEEIDLSVQNYLISHDHIDVKA